MAAIAMAAGTAQAKLTLDLDFSMDTNGFFNTGTTNGALAKATLIRAADFYSDRFLDTFSAIAPGAGDSWTPQIFSVSNGASVTLPSISIAANSIKIYAGGRSLGTGILGQGGPGGFTTASGSTAFLNAVQFRGQSGAAASPPTDFGNWGGSIVFDNDGSSVFDYDYKVAPTTSQYDLYSVAIHELGHLLGFGLAPSFTTTYTTNLQFTGPKAKALNGGVNVPLSPDGGHLSKDVRSTVTGTDSQDSVLSPTITNGQRKLPTVLDWAVFDDFGYDLAKPGDANASGNVNFDDLVILSQNYNKSGTDISWSEGDFNYDGIVNFDDLIPLAQNYNTSGALLTSGQVAALGASFTSDWALAQSLVPEPATFAALLASAPVVARRTRRVNSFHASR